ncbi:astacin-like metalloendopeptidase [Homarus americanus]|uniref:astacin-like metalloendopeptidase n=1 Tax=Homarus americanus TaxID=6706 RepID=UPI001C465DA5|nr:astacin-like metalloendopeptidase [Homarus americanus]
MRYSVLAWAVSMLYVWGVRSEASTVTVAKNTGKGGDDWQIQPKGGNDWEIQPKGGDDWQIQPKQSSFVSCGEHTLEPGTSVGIQSKNFPNQYPNRHNCVWTFKASASDSTISIDCATFNLKNSRRCRGDVLLLEDGNTLNNRFCGNLGTLSEGGDTDLLNIVFKTNRRGKAQGFSCVVSASGKFLGDW